MVTINSFAHRPSSDLILEATGIKKSFNRVEVLHGVDFALRRGEVHGIVGQNGAGKSTLMKIINGVYVRDEGVITIDGKTANYDTPNGAKEHGIAMVFQEFSLVPSMTVAQNLFLANEKRRGLLNDDKAMREQARLLFDELGVKIDPDALLSHLPVGERQVVEICKAISHHASIMIMDEPTASLSSVEIRALFQFIHKLQSEGLSIVFVSHHLNEVMEICDRVTVIRDGVVSLSSETASIQLEDIITAMIGKKMEASGAIARQALERRKPLLSVEKISSANHYHDVSFSLYPGEVLGIAGVLGSGRTELVKSLFGILKIDSGIAQLEGRTVQFNHPADAINAGLFLVTEDRRKTGLVMGATIRNNVLLPIWSRLKRLFFIDDHAGDRIVRQHVEDLQVRMTGIDQLVQRLSGGNQQKVVFAKSIASQPKILMLDDPTVGVDIATKKEIAAIVRRFAEDGNGVILISSEMEELADMCDRILILWRGQVVEEINCYATAVTEEILMKEIHGNAAKA